MIGLCVCIAATVLQFHWTAVLVDLQVRTFRYCDSLSSDVDKALAMCRGVHG